MNMAIIMIMQARLLSPQSWWCTSSISNCPQAEADTAGPISERRLEDSRGPRNVPLRPCDTESFEERPCPYRLIRRVYPWKAIAYGLRSYRTEINRQLSTYFLILRMIQPNTSKLSPCGPSLLMRVVLSKYPPLLAPLGPVAVNEHQSPQYDSSRQNTTFRLPMPTHHNLDSASRCNLLNSTWRFVPL